MIISGWGDLSSGGGSPNILNVAYVPLITSESCSKNYENYGLGITDDMVCAAFASGKRGLQGVLIMMRMTAVVVAT